MNNRYYQALLESKFSPEFVADLEELCDKHNINDSLLTNKMYDMMQEEFDREDITCWLEGSSYPTLAENDKFVDYLAYRYRKCYNTDYSEEDNITMAFSFVADMPEWKEIVDAADEDCEENEYQED